MARYYFANDGSDANDGLSPASPFKTLPKIQALPLESGDTLYFKSGDTFYGRIELPVLLASETPLTLTSYGSGERPKICGYKVVKAQASWTEHAANIWKIDLTNQTKFSGNIYSWNANVGFLKVDGVIKPVKRWEISTLAAEWEFYSDEAQWLYVYCESNPNAAAVEIDVALSERMISLGNSVNIINLEFFGTGDHAIKSGLPIENVKIINNVIHEVGGGRHPSAAGLRYGNGIEIWTEAKNVLVEGNTVYDVYDAAYTAQGDITGFGWDNVVFRGNKAYNCNQSFEVWSQNNVVGAGFKDCLVENNIFLNAGYGWSSGVRPDQETKCHLLIYNMQAPVTEIKLRNNVFYMAKSSLYHTPTGDPIPAGYDSDYNFIFLEEDTPIHDQAAYTVADYQAFVVATGKEVNSKFFPINSGSGTVGDMFSRIIGAVGVAASQNNVQTDVINGIVGKIESLRSLVVSNSYAVPHNYGYLKPVGGYITKADTEGGSRYAPLCSVYITNKYSRFDMTMIYMLCANSVVPRGGVGILDIQVVPDTTNYPANTLVGITVNELESMPGSFAPSDFVFVMTDETGTDIRGTLYFDIGKIDYYRLSYQPLTLYANNTSSSGFIFSDQANLLAELPSGTQTRASNASPTYIKKPSTGTSAPSSTPLYIGQEYIDTSNKKAYKAMGVASSADWIALN